MFTQTISLSYMTELLFNIVYLILLTVIILSWIPIFDVRREPLASMHRFYNFIMAPFRALIPPIGMIDFSPVFAFMLLGFLENTLLALFGRLGL